MLTSNPIAGFYSDPHFGQENVIKYCDRPFSDVEDMTEQLITRYNQKIGLADTVIWVGDCFFYYLEKAKDILGRLNGTKILVMGNHDKSKTWMLKAGFDLVIKHELFLDIGGRVCQVCHFPYKGSSYRKGKLDERYSELRPLKVKGEILIHGHTHSDKKRVNNMIHVGVDAWDYYPALWNEVEELVKETK